MTEAEKLAAPLVRPIIAIENRTAQEVFDIMCDRIRGYARAGRIAAEREAVPGARATTAEAWAEVLEERLEQAAHNLEVGAQLYECPGLEKAGKLARQVLKGSNNG